MKFFVMTLGVTMMLLIGQCVGQEVEWKPSDSIVNVFLADENSEQMSQGVVFNVHEGKAYIWVRAFLEQEIHEERTDTSRSIRSPSILVRGDEFEAEYVPAELLMGPSMTGGPSIYVADAKSLPPPVEFGRLTELTEGDQLTNVAWNTRVVSSNWLVERQEFELKVQTVGSDFSKARAAEKQPEPGFVFGEDGKWYGNFLTQKKREGVTDYSVGSIKRIEFLGLEHLTLFRRFQGVRDVSHQDAEKPIEMFAGINPLFDGAVESIQVRYQLHPNRQGSFPPKTLSESLDTVAMEKISRNLWPELQRLEGVEGYVDYPAEEIWAARLEMPAWNVDQKKAFQVDYQFLFTYKGMQSQSPVYRSYYSSPHSATNSNSLALLDLSKCSADLPLRLSNSATRVQRTELESKVQLLGLSPAEPIVKFEDLPDANGFKKRHISRPINILRPLAFNTDETRVAIAVDDGRLAVCDAESWEVVSPVPLFEKRLKCVAWWRDHLFVMTHDRSRVLKIDPATMDVVAEIGMPKLFRGLDWGANDVHLLLQDNCEYGFVCSFNQVMSINLKTNQAEYWTLRSWDRGRRSRLEGEHRSNYRLTPDGKQLVLRCPAGYALIDVGEQLVLRSFFHDDSRNKSLTMDAENHSLIISPVMERQENGATRFRVAALSLDDFETCQDLMEITNDDFSPGDQWELDPVENVFYRLKTDRSGEQELSVVDREGNELAVIDRMKFTSRRGPLGRATSIQLLPKSRRLIYIGYRVTEYQIPKAGISK